MTTRGRATGYTDRPDPNFLIGRVVDADSNGSLEVVTPDDQVRTAALSSDAAYWKAGAWNRQEVMVGDCVMGRGELDPAGTLHVDRVWANVMKIDGTVETADRASAEVRLRGSDAKRYALRVTPETVGVDRRNRQRSGDPTVVPAGEPAVAIAYRDPKTGRLYAHRIESSLGDPDAPTPTEPDEPRPAKAAAGSVSARTAAARFRQGNASYFCCNTSGGCGCGSAPAGFCSGCHSASWQMAWPKITGCTASCVGCCLPADFERFACHTDLFVENVCQPSGGAIQVAIKDCGPNPRCRTTGCMGWESVRFDLTACAFSALGGSFSIGHMNVYISYP